MSNAAADIPASVARILSGHLATLRAYRLELDRYRVFGARYEAEACVELGAQAREADAAVDEFLRIASTKKIDGSAVIEAMGGRPSIAISPKAAEWMRDVILAPR